MKTILGAQLTGSQYAYQRQRSTELLLADLDTFIGARTEEGKRCYVVGLDIEGAFDNADLVRILDTLEYYQVPLTG